MAIVHLKDWIIHMVSERPWLRPPPSTKHVTMIWGLQHDCTVKSTPPPRFASPSRDIAVAADKHDLACDHVCATPAPTTVGCHTVSRVGVGVCDCCSHVWEGARKHLSLLTSSVCLAACLIARVCPAKGGAGANAAKRNLAPASRKQTYIYGINAHPGENVASLESKKNGGTVLAHTSWSVPSPSHCHSRKWMMCHHFLPLYSVSRELVYPWGYHLQPCCAK